MRLCSRPLLFKVSASAGEAIAGEPEGEGDELGEEDALEREERGGGVESEADRGEEEDGDGEDDEARPGGDEAVAGGAGATGTDGDGAGLRGDAGGEVHGNDGGGFGLEGVEDLLIQGFVAVWRS